MEYIGKKTIHNISLSLLYKVLAFRMPGVDSGS